MKRYDGVVTVRGNQRTLNHRVAPPEKQSKNIEDARGLSGWRKSLSNRYTLSGMNRLVNDFTAPATQHMPATDKMIEGIDRIGALNGLMTDRKAKVDDTAPANFMSATTAKRAPAASTTKKQAAVDKRVIDTIMKEAVAYDPEDMSNIASVMHNRSISTGTSLTDVALAPGEFSAATRKSWPAGANTPKNRALAEQALRDVMTKGPTTDATYYATPDKVGRLPSGLSKVGKTKGHQYYTDPKNRPVGTRKGYITPKLDRLTKFAEKVGQSVQTSAVDAVQALKEAVGLPNTVQRGKPSKNWNTDENLGPVGELGVERAKAKVDYNMGPNRPNKPTGDIVDRISASVAEALGPGYSVDVTSGMEHPGRQYGSNRHKTGTAADFGIIGPDGKTLSSKNPAQRAMMEKVAETAAKNGITGIGVGTDYMGGNHMHFDTAPIGPGQDNEWGNIGNSLKGTLASARKGLLSETSTTPSARPQSPSEIATSLQSLAEDRSTRARTPAKASPKAKAAFDAIAAGATLAPDRKMDTLSGRPRARVGAPEIDTSAPVGTPGPMGTTVNPTAQAAMAKLGDLVGGMVGKQAQPSARKSEQESMAALESMMPGFAATPSPQAKPAQAIAPVTRPSITKERVKDDLLDPNASVLSAPALAAPTTVKSRTVADVPLAQPEIDTVAPVTRPAAPAKAKVGVSPAGAPSNPSVASPRSFSVADVDAGLADVAYDNTGQNIVGRDSLGRRSVTNKWGKTTVTNAAGNQVATVDNGPLSRKSLSQDPNESIFDGIGNSIKSKVEGIDRKSVVGTLLGGAVGSLLGPGGAAVGATLGSKLAKGRLGSLFDKNTFPDAPSQPANKGTSGGGHSISKASRAEIDRSAGGLY